MIAWYMHGGMYVFLLFGNKGTFNATIADDKHKFNVVQVKLYTSELLLNKNLVFSHSSCDAETAVTLLDRAVFKQ